MKDLYVTTTETLYPNSTNFSDVVVRMYGRDSDHELVKVTIRGFEPYFYTNEESFEAGPSPAEIEEIERVEKSGATPLSDRYVQEPRQLVKVVTSHPGAVPSVRRQYELTWGADVIFTERFRIDNQVKTGISVPEDAEKDDGHYVVDADEIESVEMKDVEPRVLTLDIETDDRGAGFPDPGEARILSVVAHDSYDDEYVGFLDLDGRSFESHFDLDESPEDLDDLGLNELDTLNFEADERRMLIAFASWVSDKDPDLICGWNSGDDSNDGFDLPHLIERMANRGANPVRLSRDGEVEVTDHEEVEIAGRSVYDLMDGWEDTKFTQPRSSRLDYVALQELDDEKIPHNDMGFYEMYREDPVKFLNYNAKDVRLTVQINEEANVLGFKKRLKDMIGVDWHRTHQNNQFIEMSVRRKCREHGLVMITSYDNEYVQKAREEADSGVNYEGARVLTAFNGLKTNVCGVDLASLYPMTQWMLNASPDARITEEQAMEGDIPYVVSENGVYYRNDKDGIIRELVDEYHQVKAEFKAKRNAADYGTDEWQDAAEAYNVTKTIYNSYYGFSGWDRSPLYDPEAAAAITLTGQRVLQETENYINEETIANVVYGDTDSNYVEFPSDWDQEMTLGYAEQICESLTNEVYPALASSEFNIPTEQNRWEIEVEMRAERFFMSGSKKKYAYLKMWDEGDPFDHKINDGDGKFSVTGYQCVKSNFALMTKEVQEKILEAIVRGQSKSDVAEMAFDAASSIDPDHPDWEYLGIPQGLRKQIDKARSDTDDAYSWSSTGDYPRDETPRAAYFSNELLDVKFEKGDKPLRVKVKPGLTVNGEDVDVVAFETEEDLEPIADEVRLDPVEMQRKLIELPMEDIFEAFELEMDSALRGEAQEQSGLQAFA